MIFIVTILMFLSLQRTHILTVHAVLNAAETFHVHDPSKIYFTEENHQENENQIKKMSGIEESENKQTFMVEKFRTLLGLNRFHSRGPSYDNSDFVSPSHSPPPNPEPKALAPALHVLLHSHPPRYDSHKKQRLNKVQHGDRARVKRTLVAVLVSGGVATLICALGCFWVCGKFRNQKKKPKRTIPLFSKKGRTRGTYQNSSRNVSLSYENIFSLKQTCERSQSSISSHSSPTCTIYEKEIESCQEQEVINPEYENASSSSTKEILSVHEDLESVKYEYNGCNSCFGDSDNESFHSCVDSHSPILVFSNASSGSLNEILSLSPRNSILSSTSKVKSSQSPFSPKQEGPRKIETYFQCPQSSTYPPPSPPPPPLPLPQQLGKDGNTLPKLKPLHWDKVRANPDRIMVWDKLQTSSFELDEEMMEALFGYNLQNSMKNDETKSKSPSPMKHVLEPKRLQNITILSKALSMTAEQVCEALIQGKGLSLQQLEALLKMVPTKEEEAKLLTYKDVNELGSAEKFVRAMLSIPFSFQRVEAMLYEETFEDEIVHLNNSFSAIEEACKELRSSKLFLTLLEAVLKTGNRMNVGTIRGGARAFKLDALLKLSDVKGTDGKTTLLHFFVQEIVRSEGIRASSDHSIKGKKSENRTKEEEYKRIGLELVSGLSTELSNVKKTATIDLDVLSRSVSNLSDGMANMQKLVKGQLHEDKKCESFVNSMKCFLNYAVKKVHELQGEKDRVLTRVKEINEYFHGDVSNEDPNPLGIFMIVKDFLDMLDNVCNELRSSTLFQTQRGIGIESIDFNGEEQNNGGFASVWVRATSGDTHLGGEDFDHSLMDYFIQLIEKQLIRDAFDGKELSRGINPDEAVAIGAAIQGGILSSERGEETKSTNPI
ncbi:formin-like protein 11 [Abrus precatorius]|uniref:Formin-like protein n=1 Tax=Abrus precatorius TaxID=3816 RepID=A0A8B8L044_ABRPR|nr:formin-like protein 11 [Abrus precatorius]